MNEVTKLIHVLRYFSVTSMGNTLARSPIFNWYNTNCLHYRVDKGRRRLDLIVSQMGEWSLFETIKDKYDTFRGKHGLDVKRISDPEVKFMTQVLAYKLLCKCQKDHHCDREMQGRHADELGNLPRESILARLHRSWGKRCGISLCVATYSYFVGQMAGACILTTHVCFMSQSIGY